MSSSSIMYLSSLLSSLFSMIWEFFSLSFQFRVMKLDLGSWAYDLFGSRFLICDLIDVIWSFIGPKLISLTKTLQENMTLTTTVLVAIWS